MSNFNHAVIQKKLFSKIYEKTKKGSIAKSLQETLNISRTAAYQRIRGETIITLQEFLILLDRYEIHFADLDMPNTEKNQMYRSQNFHD